MSRKYRQRGYMESDRDDRPPAPKRKPSTPEERAHRKGLRHAVDREANEVMRCHNCGKNVQDFGVITADSKCPHCDAALHCCRTCKFFDSGARWQCRAEIPKPIPDKTRPSDCRLYAPRLVLDATGRRNGNAGAGGDPKSMFENLFKN